MELADTERVDDRFLFSESSQETDRNSKIGSRDAETDRGWAWLILAGAVLTKTIVIGCFRTGGILFIHFKERFHSSSADTSVISTVLNVTFCLAAPLVMTIGVKMTSYSSIVFFGGVLFCTSYITTAFVHEIRMALITHGVLIGLGMACTESPAVSMVTKYFEKRRGLANSVTSAGGSLGGLIIPPLVTVLFEKYGYRGCLIIIAGLSLNISVTAVLFRHQFYYSKSEGRYAENVPRHKRSPLKYLVDLLDFKVFREPVFLLFQLSFGLLSAAYCMCIFFIAPFANDVNIGSAEIATLVVIFSATDMFSRLLLGVVSDLGLCKRSTIVCICAIVLCIITNFARYYNSFGFLVIHTFVCGLTGGSVLTQYGAIIADNLPMKYLDSTVGFAMLSFGSFCGIFLYVGGILRDTSGSYVATFHLVGALALSGGAIMAIVPFVSSKK